MEIKSSSYKLSLRPNIPVPHKSYEEKQLSSLDTFQPSSEKEKEWTLLFYNVGDKGEAKMCTASLLDLEKVGSDENTNVVVMNYRSPNFFDRLTGTHKEEFHGTKTYYVTKNQETEKESLISEVIPEEVKNIAHLALTSPKDIKSPVIKEHPRDLNLGKKDTLREFLLENIKKYPAKHYAVVLSGHGLGVAGSMVFHENGEKKPSVIRHHELDEVFKEVNELTGHKVDLVNMNTCFGANIESLYPLRDSVQNVVASENVVFAGTQPFSAVLSDLQNGIKEGKDISGKDLANLFVGESKRQTLGNLYMETLSAMDMEKFGSLVKDVENLQEILMSEGVPPENIKKAIIDSQRIDFKSIPKEVKFTDIGSFAKHITSYTDSQKVKEAAEKVKKSLSECVFAEQHASHERETVLSRQFRGARGEEKDLSDLSGLTIYYEDDAHNPDSWVDMLQQKTTYVKDVKAEKFLNYISEATEKEKSERSLFRRVIDKFKEKRLKIKDHLQNNTGIYGFVVNMMEQIGKMGSMVLGIDLMEKAGLLTSPVGYGLYIGMKGPVNTYEGIKDAVAISSKEKLDTFDKEKLVDNIGKAAMGVTLGAYGLYMVGLLSSGIVIPAVATALSIRIGKEIIKVAMNHRENKEYKAETERFSRMTTGEKLEYIASEKKEKQI